MNTTLNLSHGYARKAIAYSRQGDKALANAYWELAKVYLGLHLNSKK